MSLQQISCSSIFKTSSSTRLLVGYDGAFRPYCVTREQCIDDRLLNPLAIDVWQLLVPHQKEIPVRYACDSKMPGPPRPFELLHGDSYGVDFGDRESEFWKLDTLRCCFRVTIPNIHPEPRELYYRCVTMTDAMTDSVNQYVGHPANEIVPA